MDQLSKAGRTPNHSFSTRSDDLPLRKLLRCKQTKAFLTPDGDWTQDIQKALHLSEPAEAKALSEGLNPQELEVYYSFVDHRESQWDFTLPLH